MKHDDFCKVIGCREFVRGAERRKVARPQPPMQDRRTKRERDRSSQRRRAIEESR